MTRKAWFEPLPPGKFPYADSERLDQVPPACRRCGGPWFDVDEGKRCLTCGARWRVAECLRAMLWREFAHTENDAHLVTPVRTRRGG